MFLLFCFVLFFNQFKLKKKKNGFIKKNPKNHSLKTKNQIKIFNINQAQISNQSINQFKINVFRKKSFRI